MNKRKIIALILTMFIFTPALVAAKGGGGGRHHQGKGNAQSAPTELTAEQKETLLWMHEEEKLARDVYITLYNRWQQPVFKNIARSEQKHMIAMQKKVDMFGLNDSISPEIGDFSYLDLQQFYDEFIIRGEQSYVEALRVGALIEDMDIVDLQTAIDGTDNLALKTSYKNLLEASKNHLRAFVGRLRQQGEDYIPQHIEQELFDAILGF